MLSLKMSSSSWTNVLQVAPLGNTTTAVGWSASPTKALTTGTANSAIIAVTSRYATGAVSADTFTSSARDLVSTDTFDESYQITTTAGSNTYTLTSTGSQDWCVIVSQFKIASTGATASVTGDSCTANVGTASAGGLGGDGNASATGDTCTSSVGTAAAWSGGASLYASLGSPTFEELFSSTTVSQIVAGTNATWIASSGGPANYGVNCNTTWVHTSSDMAYVTGGGIRFRLTQPTAGTATGCEIVTQAGAGSTTQSDGIGDNIPGCFGYGYYEFCMKSGSVDSTDGSSGADWPGSISACFTYIGDNTGSITEIDCPELEGSQTVYSGSITDTHAEWTVWAEYPAGKYNSVVPVGSGIINPDKADAFSVASTPWQTYHYYGFHWTAGEVDFYLDGVLVGTITGTGVPTVPRSEERRVG